LVLFFCIFSCYAAAARLFLPAPALAQVGEGRGIFARRRVFFAGNCENGLYLPVKQVDDRAAGTKGEGGKSR